MSFFNIAVAVANQQVSTFYRCPYGERRSGIRRFFGFANERQLAPLKFFPVLELGDGLDVAGNVMPVLVGEKINVLRLSRRRAFSRNHLGEGLKVAVFLHNDERVPNL